MRTVGSVGSVVRACTLGLVLGASTMVRAETVVSFTFDDCPVSQRMVKDLLAPYGMKATFFIVTNRIGTDRFAMTLEDLRDLAAAGHEIGSHTVTHRKLTTIPSLEERRQELCDSRSQLRAWGFPAVSFAYPSSGNDGPTERLAAECGYESGRDTFGLSSCSSCPPAGPIVPANRFAIPTPPSVVTGQTLAELQRWVVAAEQAGGGWVPIVFHKVADSDTCGTNPYCISPAVLTAFAEWLGQRQSLGTTVKTVHEVMGGGAPTPVLLQNPSLEEDAGGDGVPDCWQQLSGGVPGSTPARVTDAYEGAVGHRLELTEGMGGQLALVVQREGRSCAPAALPNHRYRLTFWYRSDAQPRPEVSFQRKDGTWTEWTAGLRLRPSGTWTQATWDTPAVPKDAVALSVGVRLDRPGRLDVDGFALLDTGLSSREALQVLWPNGGEVLRSGTDVDVTWASEGEVPRVDVAFSTDEGASWQAIATNVANTGSLPWRIPRMQETHARVRVSSTGGANVMDESDSPVLIAAPEPPGSGPVGGGNGEDTPADGDSQLLKPGSATERTGCGGKQAVATPALLLLALMSVRARRERGGTPGR